MHGADELVCGCVLEQEPAGTGAQRFVDVLVEVEGGEHEDPWWLSERGCLKDLSSRFQPVHHRHANVHQHDVWREFQCLAHGFGAVSGVPDDGHVALRCEQCSEALADHGLVVGDEAFDLRERAVAHVPARGMVAATA